MPEEEQEKKTSAGAKAEKQAPAANELNEKWEAHEERFTRAVLPVEPLPGERARERAREAGEKKEKGAKDKQEDNVLEEEILASRSKKELAAGVEDKRLRDNIGQRHKRNFVSPEAVRLKKGLSFSAWIMANPVRLIAVSFALVILAGALLLMLPFSSAHLNWTDFSTAVFTSTSAVCVTGLVLVDTGTYWSPFGHAVIISLIQIGGIGLITIIGAFFSFSRKKMNLKILRGVQDSIGCDSAAEVYQMVKRVLAVTFIVEFIGGLILSLRYLAYMPAGDAFYCGMFQGISAFCNAGFDLLGPHFGRYASLTLLQQDPVILLVTAFLLTFGGIGFMVWMDLLAWPKTKKLAFHSKAVLLLTGGILLLGTILFMLIEWNNTGELAMGTFPWQERPVAALFQTATLRTAGFNSINQANLRESSKLLSCLIMFVGAAPVSTGGGMKVTTCAIVTAGWRSNMKGKRDVHLFGHKISPDILMRAFVIFFMGIMIAIASTFVLCLTERISLEAGKFTPLDLLFESMSALCTVGVTSLQTENLSFWGRLPLILAMYMGRIGPFSFALLISLRSQKPENVVLPEGETFVG